MTRLPPRTVACAAAALALALPLAACGGGDDGDAAATTAAADTTQLAASTPLDQSSWDAYVAARTQAQAVNQKATATFQKCRDLVSTGVEEAKIEACLGSSAQDVVAEGKKFLAVIQDSTADAQGSCAAAATQVEGNVKLYVSSVNAIDLTIQGAGVLSSQDIGTALATLGKAREAGTAFDAACSPS